MNYYNEIDAIINVDIIFEEFIFKYQHSFENKLMYEVYPKNNISPIDFTNRIIYNDKLRYHLSSIFGVGINDIDGYITSGDDNGIDIMHIIITLISTDKFCSLLENNQQMLLLEDFSPIQFDNLYMPTALSITQIDTNINDSDEIINKPYVATVAITNILEKYLGSDQLYNIFAEEIPKIINNLINPYKPTNTIGFTTSYFVRYTMSNDIDSLINPMINMLVYIVYEVSTISGSKIKYLSNNALGIEKNIEIDDLPINTLKHFFHNDLIYREPTLINSYISDRGEQIDEYTIDEIVCTFGKKASFKSKFVKVMNFGKMVWKEDKLSSAIYRNKDVFNKKIKYGGFINDPNINKIKVEEKLKTHPLFRNRRIHSINTIGNTNFFVLLPR